MSSQYMRRNWDEGITTPMLVTPHMGVYEVRPAGKTFTLDELQKLCGGGSVQLITLPNGLQMWMNEEGKLNNFPFNATATMIWQVVYHGYKIGADDFMVGPVLITPSHYTE